MQSKGTDAGIAKDPIEASKKCLEMEQRRESTREGVMTPCRETEKGKQNRCTVQKGGGDLPRKKAGKAVGCNAGRFCLSAGIPIDARF